MIWFTADTHLGHTNIIDKCKRPFDTVTQHDNTILDNINERVSENDTLYHLGDFALPHSYYKPNAARLVIQEYRNRINCRNVVLVMGNHDPHLSTGQPKLWMFDVFSEIHQLVQFNMHDSGTTHKIVLCHYGLETWNRSHHGSIMLHGHSHGGLVPRPGRLDVGVDNWNFVPLALPTVIHYIKEGTSRA